MQTLARLFRVFAMLAASAALFPFALSSRLFEALGARRLALVLGVRIQELWARACLFCVGVRIEVEGAPPRERCLVIANHVSYLDILVLGRVVPGRFVAKSEIAGWPLLGWLARSVGTLFVERARRRDVLRVGEEMQRTLASGMSVVLFPEGGASRGLSVQRLKSPLLEWPARRAIPCLPVALTYETPRSRYGPAWTVCWWGGMDFPRHFWRLLGLGGVVAHVRFAAGPVVGDDRKTLAAKLHAALEVAFRPVRQEPIPLDLPWRHLLAPRGFEPESSPRLPASENGSSAA